MGRIMANEDDVVRVLREGNLMTLDVVDTAALPYEQQLQVGFPISLPLFPSCCIALCSALIICL